ncbi:tetratricopeptide repeat protein [Polynucleobacter campilacus]|uniref:tetratricopeptide repeat protein n=1 Tax=Polynucleobacter campilacus TaxID=1743163 RepID=UPI00197FFA41|nr:tetratricopeptide repeat protein [Polynucleobacter campilacus]
MPATIPAPPRNIFKILAAMFATGLILGCSTPAQQRADAEIRAANTQEMKSSTAPQGYLGGYSPNDPPRLSSDTAYDPLNSGLSETVALPLLSFLIIEPDPITKNAVPSDVEKLVKARKFEDAIDLINSQLKKTPRNVQLRFVKARVQMEMRQFNQAKKTLIEITQQFPELPEPYNNLAAIAANQGNWIEARDYLELALKLRPSYAIASANLGEIYIRLGAQAYENAAKNTQLNQGLYTRRSKALTDILKPPPKRQLNQIENRSLNAADAQRIDTPPTNLPESRSK